MPRLCVVVVKRVSWEKVVVGLGGDGWRAEWPEACAEARKL